MLLRRALIEARRASAMGQARPIADDVCDADHDAEFVALQAAFRRSGGVERADRLACAMGALPQGDAFSLDRLILSKRIFSFDWHGEVWVPLFQLDRRSLSPRSRPARVLAELRPVCDGWAILRWYARPNRWLQDLAPIDLLDSQPDQVLAAARAVHDGCRAADAIDAPWR